MNFWLYMLQIELDRKVPVIIIKRKGELLFF